MLFLKSIAFLWPFLWEVIVGKRVTIEQAFKTEPKKLLVVIIFVLSLGLNIWGTARLIAISNTHVELERKYRRLVEETHPSEALQKDPLDNGTFEVQHFKAIRAELLRMQQQERTKFN